MPEAVQLANSISATRVGSAKIALATRLAASERCVITGERLKAGAQLAAIGLALSNPTLAT